MFKVVIAVFYCTVAACLVACSSGSSELGEGVSSSHSSSSSSSSISSSNSTSSGGSVAAPPADSTPDPVEFENITEAEFGRWVDFAPVELTGINAPVTVSITGGEYAIDGGAFTDQPGSIEAHQQLAVRIASANQPLTAAVAQLKLGEQTYHLSVTTKDDAIAPEGRITFPAGNAATEESMVTVSGFASDNDRVVGVTVNGHEATSNNDFRTWTALVPIEVGMNQLVLAIEDAAGNVSGTADEASVDRQSPLDAPEGIYIDKSANLAYVTDYITRSVYTVDLASGNRVTISGASRGEGPRMIAPGSLVLTNDKRYLYIADARDDVIYRVDVASGDRKIISSNSIGNGPDYIYPVDLVLGPGEEHLWLTEGVQQQLLRVDVTTGNRVVVSGSGMGTGPLFESPEGLALSADGSLANVVDRDGGAIFTVDLSNGNRAIVSDDSSGEGPSLVRPSRVVVEPVSGRLLVVDRYRLVTVDPATGDREILSDEHTGAGIETGLYSDIGIGSANHVLLTDRSNHAVVKIDLTSGDRAIFSGKAGNYANEWELPVALAYSEDDNVLIVGDPWRKQVLAVDFDSRESSVLVDGTAEEFSPSIVFSFLALDQPGDTLYVAKNLYSKVVGYNLATQSGTVIFDEEVTEDYRGIIGSIVADPARQRLYYTARDAASIYQVDVITGERFTISSPEVGSGEEIRRPVDLAMDSQNNRLFVAYDTAGSLFSVDIATGERQVVTSAYLGVGTGPSISHAEQFDVDLDSQLAWVVTFTSDEVIQVDLANGNRTLVSSGAVNGGPSVAYADDLVYSQKMQSLFITTPNEGYVVQLDLLSGERLLLFP